MVQLIGNYLYFTLVNVKFESFVKMGQFQEHRVDHQATLC